MRIMTDGRHAGFNLTLRPERSMTDEQATRSLRALLKAALRSYGLRCTNVEPVSGAPPEINAKENLDSRVKP
jgi:sugar phosphate isomerase/epimerase